MDKRATVTSSLVLNLLVRKWDCAVCNHPLVLNIDEGTLTCKCGTVKADENLTLRGIARNFKTCVKY